MNEPVTVGRNGHANGALPAPPVIPADVARAANERIAQLARLMSLCDDTDAERRALLDRLGVDTSGRSIYQSVLQAEGNWERASDALSRYRASQQISSDEEFAARGIVSGWHEARKIERLEAEVAALRDQLAAAQSAAGTASRLLAERDAARDEAQRLRAHLSPAPEAMP